MARFWLGNCQPRHVNLRYDLGLLLEVRRAIGEEDVNYDMIKLTEDLSDAAFCAGD